MADHSKIEWTQATWNPVVGCTHLSPGCDNCYAAREASGRLAHTPRYAGLAVGGRFTGEVRLVPEVLDKPLRWRRPRMVFVNSMSDLFHQDVPDDYVARVFAVMALSARHTFQLLSKRHARMRSLLRSDGFRDAVQREVGELAETAPRHVRDPIESRNRSWLPLRPWPLPNVWLGVSVEDQQWADIRIPVLLDTPAAVRFISAEPLLGPVDLHNCGGVDTIEPDWADGTGGGTGAPHPLLDWVIIGGESGLRARPMALEWAQDLVNQCAAAGVATFVKQLGSCWGRNHKDIDHFPPGLRVREYPKREVGHAR